MTTELDAEKLRVDAELRAMCDDAHRRRGEFIGGNESAHYFRSVALTLATHMLSRLSSTVARDEALEAALINWWRLSLVIDSAVRCADGPINHEKVRACMAETKALIGIKFAAIVADEKSALKSAPPGKGANAKA